MNPRNPICFESLETRQMLASISGFVFNDSNSNGVCDAGEAPIADAPVFIDQNRNLVADPGETQISTASDGSYLFDGLAAGDHRVAHLAPQGWQRTASGAGRLYATRTVGNASSIDIFDSVSGIAVGAFQAPLYLAGQPVAMAASESSLFYTSNISSTSQQQPIFELDLNTGTLINYNTLNLPQVSDLAFLNGRLYLAIRNTGDVVEFNPATNTIDRILTLPTTINGGIAGAPDLGLLFVADAAGTAIHAVDPAQGNIVRSLPVDGLSFIPPMAYMEGILSFAPAGSNTLRRYDAISGELLDPITLANAGSSVVRSVGGDGGVSRFVSLAADQTVNLDFGEIELSPIPDRPILVHNTGTGGIAQFRVTGAKAGSQVEIHSYYVALRDNPIASHLADQDDPIISFSPLSYSFFGGLVHALQTESGKRQSLRSPGLNLAGFASPGLGAGFDSGVSSTDGITKFNQPQFNGGLAQYDIAVQVVLNGQLAGAATIESWNSYSFVPAEPLPDGLYYVNSMAQTSTGEFRQNYTSKTIIIDSQVPQFSSGRYDADAHAVGFTFNETLAGNVLPAVRIYSLASGEEVTPAGASVQILGSLLKLMLPVAGMPPLPDGRYRAVLDAGVNDLAGNAAVGPASFDFSVVGGDANVDERVDTLDFNLLAGHFGKADALFSEGDFNYDADIDSQDFNLLIAQYGTKLPLAVVVPASALFTESMPYDAAVSENSEETLKAIVAA